MFDIGFGELVLVMVVGLVVLGPEKLPIAVKTVAGWIRTMRTLASSVQNELTQELKLQELQESLKKAEKVGLQNLSPELKESMDELKEVTAAIQRSYDLKQVDTMTETVQERSGEVEAEALYDDEAHSRQEKQPEKPLISPVIPAQSNEGKNSSEAAVVHSTIDDEPHAQESQQGEHTVAPAQHEKKQS